MHSRSSQWWWPPSALCSEPVIYERFGKVRGKLMRRASFVDTRVSCDGPVPWTAGPCGLLRFGEGGGSTFVEISDF